MPKDAMGRKTCSCKPPKFYYDDKKECWCNQHGGEVRKGKKFVCPDCLKMLEPSGKLRHMKIDDSNAEE